MFLLFSNLTKIKTVQLFLNAASIMFSRNQIKGFTDFNDAYIQ